MENGTTYIVRPFMTPLNFLRRISRISAGSCQLLVGPASSTRSEQMNVRSSTRATSPGSESARYEFGRLASLRRSKVPASTSSWHIRSYSSADPSHQWIESGRVSSATSSTQSRSFLFVVGALVVSIVIGVGSTSLSSQGGKAGLCHTRTNRSPPARSLDVALGGRRPVLAAGDQHEALELGHQDPVLVVHPRVHLHGAAVGLGLGLALLEHLGLHEQRVAVEDGCRVLELLGGEVGDRLSRDI